MRVDGAAGGGGGAYGGREGGREGEVEARDFVNFRGKNREVKGHEKVKCDSSFDSLRAFRVFMSARIAAP